MGLPIATISRKYSFEAAHWLPNTPKNHKCQNVHGHTYGVRLSVCGTVDPETGMVFDFALLDKWANRCIRALDHTLLNDTINNPTAENIARHIFQLLPRTGIECKQITIRVYEGANGWAEYSGRSG